VTRHHRFALALSGWVLASTIATVAEAQSTRVRLEDLELRVDRVEQILAGQALVELSQRTDTVAAELRELRGELELLQQEIAALRKQQTDVVADFDRRLAALEARPIATVNATSEPSLTSEPVLPTESPEQLYARGFEALRAARYPEAIAAMLEFLERHPLHPLASNARYWLGQTYYLTRDYERAIDAFAAVGIDSPDPAKPPDALLKKGLSEWELRRVEQARATLNEVVRRYPNSDSARLAQEQLARMR
jgi:tol-pal system protein YbgF